ncbi:MAG TPA: SHOCT domain-containing protein [Candidatus Acidoferrales bacterium]|nr:SHOCT domain-containing protein [Candidatus Acidoferrales bacterium]
MALADELKTLQELHEKGKLTDQEFADAKAATLKKLVPASEHRERVPLMSWPFKVLLGLLLVLLGFAWYNAGTRKTTKLIADAVHAPISLKSEVESVPANSWKAVGLDLPYSGAVDVTLQVEQGNPVDVFMVPPDQLDTMKKEDWNNVKAYGDFDATKIKTYRRTGQLGQGSYYLVIRDSSGGTPSVRASDISVKVQLNP